MKTRVAMAINLSGTGYIFASAFVSNLIEVAKEYSTWIQVS